MIKAPYQMVSIWVQVLTIPIKYYITCSIDNLKSRLQLTRKLDSQQWQQTCLSKSVCSFQSYKIVVRRQSPFPIFPFYSILLLLPFVGIPFLLIIFLILLYVTCTPVMVTSSYIVAHLSKGSLVLFLQIPLPGE